MSMSGREKRQLSAVAWLIINQTDEQHATLATAAPPSEWSRH